MILLNCLTPANALPPCSASMKDILIPEAWDQNVLEIRQNLMAYGDKWYKFLIGGYGNAKKQLAAMSRMPLPSGTAEKIRIVDAISESRRLEKTLSELEPLGRAFVWQQVVKTTVGLGCAGKNCRLPGPIAGQYCRWYRPCGDNRLPRQNRKR